MVYRVIFCLKTALTSKKYENLYEINDLEMPTDIQVMINNNEIGSTLLRIIEVIGQATKGSRRIPRHTEAMKDVVTCDKSRGVGSTL